MKLTLVALFACGTAVAVLADEVSLKLVAEAEAALKAGKPADAVALAEKAAKADPKDAAPPLVAGVAHSRLRQHDEAVKSFTAALVLDPKRPRVHDLRGDAYLKLGKFKEAVADFDVFLKANPAFAPEHWRRGIALYYAGRFDDGVKQFDIHRTVNPEDVENSAWHYLCNARATSPKKARADLIPVTKDARVPMKEVLELFAGKIKPQDVIAAAENSKLKDRALTSARFYAHLYVALYYEAEGDAAKTLDHLKTAVEKHKIGDYMWDVGNAHLEMLKKAKK